MPCRTHRIHQVPHIALTTYPPLHIHTTHTSYTPPPTPHIQLPTAYTTHIPHITYNPQHHTPHTSHLTCHIPHTPCHTIHASSVYHMYHITQTTHTYSTPHTRQHIHVHTMFSVRKHFTHHTNPLCSTESRATHHHISPTPNTYANKPPALHIAHTVKAPLNATCTQTLQT